MNEQELSNYIMGNHVRIDEKIAHIAQKNSGRKGMTSFTLACYVWQTLQNFKTMSAESVILTAVNNWDSLTWKNTNIPIGLWNRLFNDYPLSPDNWRQIACPLMFVEDIVTSVTVPNRTKLCHFAYISTSSTQKYPLICTDTAYRKTMSGKASKLTTYIYGEATGKQDTPYELLRHEAVRIVMPIR